MSAVSSQGVQAWAPVASATATLLAVLVALFGERGRAWWWRPRLELVPFDARLFDGWVQEQLDGSRVVFVRLRLQNVGRSEANAVEVVIERLDDATPADVLDSRAGLGRDMIPGLAGRQLKWADRDTATIDIPAKTARRFDVLKIVETDARRSGDAQPIVPLQIALFTESVSGRHILASTNFAFEITIQGRNVRPVKHRVSVSFSGRWVVDANSWSAMGDSFRIAVA